MSLSRVFLEDGSGLGAAVMQELSAPGRLVVLPDRLRRLAEHVQGTQEAPVRLMAPRDRPVTAPPGPPKLVKPPVITGPRVRVRRNRVAAGVNPLSQHRPSRRIRRKPPRDRLHPVHPRQAR